MVILYSFKHVSELDLDPSSEMRKNPSWWTLKIIFMLTVTQLSQKHLLKISRIRKIKKFSIYLNLLYIAVNLYNQSYNNLYIPNFNVDTPKFVCVSALHKSFKMFYQMFWTKGTCLRKSVGSPHHLASWHTWNLHI